MKVIQVLLLAVFLRIILCQERVQAQAIIPAQDGTNTNVTSKGNRFDITGGTLSGNGTNLFHSFNQFSLNSNQTANFLTNPAIQNIFGRVVGGNASIINGLIQVTGGNSNLFFLNPSGIIFGANARLNVPAAFTATTATGIEFGNTWWSATGSNNYSALIGTPTAFAFTTTSGGTIVNGGQLSVGLGQNLSLLGGTVVNTGQLVAPGGQITVAAVPGENLVRVSEAGHLLSLEIQPVASAASHPQSWTLPVLSLPQLLTGGQESVPNLAVNSQGQVVLTSSGVSVPTETGAATVSGNLDTSMKLSGEGGTVKVLGDRVGLLGARVNASGANGGGTVFIGGDVQNNGVAISKASSSFVSGDSTVNADALTNGNGGQVSVKATETTDVQGTLTARGGVVAGNGGFIETSSQQFLRVTSTPDASAIKGVGGTWLIDPTDVTIVNGGGGAIGTNQVDVANIDAALNSGTSVTISTSTATGPTGAGDITQNSNATISKTAGGDATLSLVADGNITLNGNINSSSGKLNLNLTANGIIDSYGNISTLGGNITAQGTSNSNGTDVNAVTFNTPTASGVTSTIDTKGGNITLNGNSNGTGPQDSGVDIEPNVNITSGGGNITFNGKSSSADGIVILSSLDSQGGSITFNGSSTGSQATNSGILAISGNISSAGGNITFNGNSTGSLNTTNPSQSAFGILVTTNINSGDGKITFNGTSQSNRGIDVEGNITSKGGDILFTGNSSGGQGIYTSGLIDSGGGNITFNGNSTGGQFAGIFVNSTINSSKGDINFTGNSSNYVGILNKDVSTIDSGGGNITFNGTSTGNGTSARGISSEGPVTSKGGNILFTGKSSTEYGIFTNNLINSSGGNITFNGTSQGTNSTLAAGIYVANANLTSGNGDITLTGNSTVTGIQASNTTIASGTGNITLAADTRNFDSTTSVTGTGNLLLQPFNANSNIVLGGDFLSAAALASFKGFATLSIGRADGSGILSLAQDITFNEPVSLRSPNGSINTTGHNITTSNSINLTASTINPGNITSSGDMTINGNVTLTQATTNLTTSNGNITFNNLVNGTTAGKQNLTLNTSAGNITLNNAVGNTQALGNFSLSTSGPITLGQVNAANLTISGGGKTQLNGNITTTGSQTYGNPVTFSNNTVLTGDGINFNNTIDGNANLTINNGNGNGNITLTGAIGSNTPLGNLQLNTTGTTTLGSIIATSLTTNGGGQTQLNDNITTTGSQNYSNPITLMNNSSLTGSSITFNKTVDGAANLNLNTGGNITFSGTVGGTTRIGNLNISNANTVSSGAISATGITVNASNNITTGNLDTSSSNGTGGAINLTSPIISTGNLISSGQTRGGDITVSVTPNLTLGNQNLTLGALNSSSSSGNAGNIKLDPQNDLQVNFINATAAGKGGNVDITTNHFFRATGNFTDRNGITASISTAGGTGDGSLTIRHGGGDALTPFILGNSITNGTADTLTTSASNSILPLRSFPGPYTQGAIQIITSSKLLDQENQQAKIVQEAQRSKSVTVSLQTTSQSQIDTIVAAIEEPFTLNYEQYLGLGKTKIATADDVRTTLRRIAQKPPGVQSAVIYAVFVSPSRTVSGNTTQQPILIPKQESENDQLELVAVTANGQLIRKRVPQATRAIVSQVVQNFSSKVKDKTSLPDDYLPNAQQLYQWLVAPVEIQLQARGIQNLVFVMDTNLRSLPVAALHDGHQFLIEKYSVGLMPSHSLTNTRYTNIQQAQVLGMGADHFNNNLETLWAVPTELDVITHKLWSGQVFLNEDFTLENLKRQRQKQPFAIVHLATHSNFNPGAANNSYIQLWDTQLRLDQMHQIDWSNPPVELLVLSACRTALGDKDAELGFTGLAVASGVKSAMGSLWEVNDEGTLALMTGFYQELKQAPIKTEALRQAQLAMLRGQVSLQNYKLISSKEDLPLPAQALGEIEANEKFTHPYYWAAFTIVGNPW